MVVTKSEVKSDSKEVEEDSSVYVAYEFQGDGRKREAKRLKSKTVVLHEEIELEEMIKQYQNSNTKITDVES